MINVYRCTERYDSKWTKEEFWKYKREDVLNAIKPICDVFLITDYDYIFNEKQERLVVEGQAIGCACNSIGATVQELINYIWIKTYAKERSLGAFRTQTLNRLKTYWIREDKE